VLILKAVKVLCFDTLLQVFILKVVRVAGSVFLQVTPVVRGSMRNRLRSEGGETPRGAYDGGSAAWRGSVEVPPTRVFSKKRLQVIENNGKLCGKERKERAKRLQTAENMGFAIEAQRHRVENWKPAPHAPGQLRSLSRKRGCGKSDS